MEDTFNKTLQSKSVLGFDSSEEITHFNNHDISYKTMRCGDCIKELWDDMSRKIVILKELHAIVKALNKNFKVPGEETFGVCKKFITKLTDYFFSIIDLGTTSFGNKPLFTQQKEKCGLIQCFGPMFIDFDEYPHYCGRESIIFEKDVDEAIKCEHSYAYSAGQCAI